MNTIKGSMLAVALLAAIAATGSARAQQDSQQESKPDSGSMMNQQPGSGSMMGHGMMGEGQSMMGGHGMMGGMGMGGGSASMCGRMTAHIEGRLAFLKAEINITPEQEALWKDYANAVRDNAKTMSGRCTSLMGDSGASEKSLPDRLDAQEQFVAARLDALRATNKALKPLYQALSDAQKKLADQLIRSSTGMM
jgi:LTXXQ motif family protein